MFFIMEPATQLLFNFRCVTHFIRLNLRNQNNEFTSQ